MAITYTPTTNFGAKDSLPTNDPNKVIKGSEFTTEFTALQTAFSLAAPNASPTFTGTVTIPTADINGGTVDGTTIGGTTPAAATFTSLTATSADINGGSIDGTVIGAATPAAGSFTTGQFGTSLNVDGTVTADGLTVEPSASTGFTVGADGTNTYLNFEANSIAASVQQYYGQAAGTAFYAVGAKDSGGTLRTAFRIDGGGDISFYEDTGTTPKFFWDASAEALGIGTSSPNVSGYDSNATALTVSGTNRGLLELRGATGANSTQLGAIRFLAGSTSEADIICELDGSGNGFLTFDTNGSEAMRIDSSGNLLVGRIATPPTAGAKIAVSGSGDTAVQITKEGVIAGRISAVSTGLAFGVDGSDGATERMRIDSSGNLLVGKTADSDAGAGVRVRADGLLQATRNGADPLSVNRLTSNGALAVFRKDNTAVGEIGIEGGDSLYIVQDDAGLRFSGGGNVIIPCQSNGGARDNALDLGSSGARFVNIYATNGTIQTSDANEKQDIAELDEAERRVAVAAKGLLRKFRWKDAVSEKGDDARIHFGIIAQDLQAAFEAEGLDAGRYGMFIHSTWTDEETGEERSRMGVRYSELLAFIIAAL